MSKQKPSNKKLQTDFDRIMWGALNVKKADDPQQYIIAKRDKVNKPNKRGKKRG
jgi:hypothetical protein